MTSLPGTITLLQPGDGTLATASDQRSNDSAVQTAINGLIAYLAGVGVGSGLELAYNEFTSNVTITPAVTEGTPTNIVSASSVTFDGGPVVIEAFLPGVHAGSGGATLILRDTTAATSLGWWAVFGANEAMEGLTLWRRMTPAAGARVYSVAGFAASGGAITVTAGAGGAGVLMPGFIRITKV